MKEITIYELLGLVKDGKAPKKIVFDGDVWYWGYDSYIPKSFLKTSPDVQASASLFKKYRIDYCLNDTVQIIEDEILLWLDENMNKNNLFYYEYDTKIDNIINCYFKENDERCCIFYKNVISDILKEEKQ